VNKYNTIQYKFLLSTPHGGFSETMIKEKKYSKIIDKQFFKLSIKMVNFKLGNEM